jgi:outer membrane cobalamin receptor
MTWRNQMRFVKIAVTLIFLLIIIQLSFAQQLTMSGKILDINTHRAIPHVNIFIKGTQIGTISDISGKFSLTISKPNEGMMLVLQHINYDVSEIALGKVELSQTFYLQPRVIPLPEVAIEAKGEKLEIDKDLPQTISMIRASDFQIRGYVDAGDLLRIDHSVQVEEDISGKKTISIRGGNPDDVVVLYNGVKMNSQFDNIFDMSLVDLEDIQRFEVIKGSNTALYGSEAFSGVINIVPRVQQDYKIRFQQRVGTYDSGNFGLHLYQNFKNLHGSYQNRQGAAKRRFEDAEDLEGYLTNASSHHTGHLEYHFSELPGGIPGNSLGVMYVQSDLSYEKESMDDSESLDNLNKLLGLRYSGDIYKLRHLNLSVSQRWLEESLVLSSMYGLVDRSIEEESINLHAEKTFFFKSWDLLFAYQFENAKLDFYDNRGEYNLQDDNRNAAAIDRNKHGLVSILKIHAPSGSDILQKVDFDVSFRHDRVQDTFDNLVLSGASGELIEGNEWQNTMLKFAANFSGHHKSYAFDFYTNIGSNFKFPSLSQLMSSRGTSNYQGIRPNLEPEKNQSVELGAILKRDLREHPVIYGWQISGNYMKNNYDNKFRPYYLVGIPFAYYDNVPDANISGFETKTSVFLLRKKFTVEFGLSSYNISDKSAFPFKYDMKQTINFMIDHAGYAFQFHWFKEGEQVGWIRQFTGQFVQVILPEFSNIDLHLSKTFSIGRLKLFGNISARNILSDEIVLEGLALRDRRYYVTGGIQY